MTSNRAPRSMRMFASMHHALQRLCVLALAAATTGACAAPAIASVAPEKTAIVDIGSLQGASYRIDIPVNFNHDLIVFFHGTATDPVLFKPGETASPMFTSLLGKGYAVLQSGYSATGWAVEQAASDTERLHEYFVGKYGAPRRNFGMGMSMGGALLALAIERNPKIYNGALSLCGAIEPSDRLMQRDFALRAAFDYYFPQVLGALVPVAASYLPDEAAEAKVAAALASNPTATRSLLSLYGAATATSLAPVLAGITYDIQEMQQRTHGEPFGNADFIYTGTDDDFALNDGVKRYRAEPKAQAYMSRWYTPSGNLLRPLLAVHDVGDPLVPASSAFEYALIAQRAGHGDNFVQQYVRHEGHCVFSPAEITRAFDELIDWVGNGKRPASGRLP